MTQSHILFIDRKDIKAFSRTFYISQCYCYFFFEIIYNSIMNFWCLLFFFVIFCSRIFYYSWSQWHFWTLWIPLIDFCQNLLVWGHVSKRCHSSLQNKFFFASCVIYKHTHCSHNTVMKEQYINTLKGSK